MLQFVSNQLVFDASNCISFRKYNLVHKFCYTCMKEHCVLHGTIFPRESISKSFGYGSMFMTTSHQSEFISLAISIKKK
jgi:inosine/xanthosine triphosphate pyrophosphatase family protein